MVGCRGSQAAGAAVTRTGDQIILNMPSDITFTRNHLAKQLAWRGQAWIAKNLLESIELLVTTVPFADLATGTPLPLADRERLRS